MRVFFKTKSIEFNLEVSPKVVLAIFLGATPSDIFTAMQTYLGYLG